MRKLIALLLGAGGLSNPRTCNQGQAEYRDMNYWRKRARAGCR